MNEAAKLVSDSLLGEDFATIHIKDKYYTVYPPTIKVICRACSAFSKIGLDGNYSKLTVIGEIPENIPHIIKGLSALIVGNTRNWRWKAHKVGKAFQSATNSDIKDAWETILPLMDGGSFFEYALSMKSAAKIVAKEKL